MLKGGINPNHPNPHPIVDGLDQVLLGAEVAFCGLDRSMAE